jgi:hypothetical protein
MPTPIKPYFRYDLRVEIPATEVAVIADALEGEELSLRERIGDAELSRQLAEQRIEIDARVEERWPDFQREVAALSAYLAEPVSGREIRVEPGPGGPLIEGWLILGRRGEAERLALDLAWDAETRSLVDLGVDVDDARRRWRELPEWVRSSLANQGIVVPDGDGPPP